MAGNNFRYTDRNFFAAGLKAKFRDNIDALRTLRAIQAEGRNTATPAEQEALSRFIGWGQFSALFNDYGGEEEWEKERALLKSMISEEEWDSAQKSVNNAHYTHPSVVDAHWQMAQRLGFKGGKFLETSAGIGYYLGMIPEELRDKTRVSAVEKDELSGAMLKLLYPNGRVETTPFEKFLAPDNFYDLTASNVPFGDFKVHDPRYNRFQANIHDYFFLKSADLTRPGGLVMHVTSSGTLDKKDSKIRAELAKTCDFVAAVRFPGDTHKANAGTAVVTDMVILRKRPPGEAPGDPAVTPKEAQPKKPGFTGTTVDSLGRLYHWVDGKRVPGPNWLDTKMVPDPAGGEPIEVNAYFADHPEQILGTLDRTGQMRGPDMKNVTKTDDYEERLQAAIDRLPADVLKPVEVSKKAFTPATLPAPGDTKLGGYAVEDGKLFQRVGAELVEVEDQPNAKDLKRIEGQLAIRDALRQLVNDQRTGQDATDSREKLNTAYDDYVEEFGFLRSRPNVKAFSADPDSDTILALENYDAETKETTKADMFSKDTIRADVPVTEAAGVSEALGVSLHETGGIDIDRMAQLTGIDKKDIAAELTEKGIAFLDPSEGWKAADQYLSGNVRRKLTLARAAAAADPAFAANVTALEKVQPVDLDATEIGAKMGASWIPPDDVKAFAAALLNGDADHFAINYVPQNATWQADFTGRGERQLARSKMATDTWATDRADFKKILNAALNNTPIIIKGGEDERIDAAGNIIKFQAVGTDKNGDAVNIVNKKATDDAAAKVKEMREKFGEWIWEDDARRERLARWYNDNVNNMVDYHANGQHQTFPGMNPAINPHPHIKDFVWQVVTKGGGLAAHEVGTGKTYAQIMSAMELKRLGLAKKPCIACLKANVEAMTDDARKLYPGAHILSTADVFDAKSRKQTVAKIMTGDYDLILMTHDNLNMIKMRPETEAKYINEELSELEAAIVSSRAADPTKGNEVVKDLNKMKANLQAKLEKALSGERKDDAVYFEDLGIDHLLIDESHFFKSLPVVTKMRRVKGVPIGRSNRATSMLMRTRWLQEHNGGGGVTFATGTPVTNTMAEVYTLQRYLQPQELKDRGIANFDAWASMFGEVTTDLEFTLKGYQPVARFKEFTNLGSLRHIMADVMDVQRVENLPKKADGSEQIVRPKRVDEVVLSPNNPAMKAAMASFVDRARSLKGQVEAGADNMLVITTDGRKAAIDLRLIDKHAKDNPQSKTNQCVANVLKIHQANPGVTQMIFSDVGVNAMGDAKHNKADLRGADADTDLDKHEVNDSDSAVTNSTLGDSNTDFHLYGDLVDKLVKGGIPRDRIANFSKLEGAKKEKAMEDMRAGKILVGLGSTQKMGTGVNVQDKLAALHHLDVPWVPAAIEQRDGRGYRQGNTNDTGKVALYRYVAEGSMDQQLWKIVAHKANFINDFLTGKLKGNTFRDQETESLSPDQLSAIASGDPRIYEKVNLDEEVRSLRAAESRHHREQNKLVSAVKAGEQQAVYHDTQAKQRKVIAQHLEADAPKEFAVTLGGKVHTDRKEAAAAFEGEVRKAGEALAGLPEWERRQQANKEVPIGKFRGLEIVKEAGHFYLKSPEGYTIETGDNLGSVEYVARNAAKKAQEAEQSAAAARADVERVRAGIGKQFAKAEELRQKHARAQELEAVFKHEAAANNPTARNSGHIPTLEAADEPPTLEPARQKKAFHHQIRLRPEWHQGKEWQERDHPRGQPENAGEFGPGGAGGGKHAAKPKPYVGKVTNTAQALKRQLGGAAKDFLGVLRNRQTLPAHLVEQVLARAGVHAERQKQLLDDLESRGEIVQKGHGIVALAKKKVTPAAPNLVKANVKAPAPLATGKPLFSAAEMAEPKKPAVQPIPRDAGYAALAEKGEQANKQLQALLDLGKGIGAQLGYDTIPPKSLTEEQLMERLRQPGGVVLLAPIKGEKRAAEKVQADYGGDWSKLLDIARASIAVDSVQDMHAVIAKLRQSGITFAKPPKDRINNPLPVGYRDVLTNVRMPNGVVAELQIHLKPMLIAKAEGHKAYETMRGIEAAASGRASKQMTTADKASYDQAAAESKRIYNGAWERAGGKAA